LFDGERVSDDGASMRSMIPSVRATGRLLRGIDLAWISAIIIIGQVTAFALGFYAVRLGADFSSPSNLTIAVLTASAALWAVLALVGGLWIAWRRNLDRDQLGARIGKGRWYAAGVGLYAMQLFVIGTIVHSIPTLGALQDDCFKTILRSGGFAWGWYVLLFILIVPATAIAEEILFRGLLFRWFRERCHIAVAVLVTAALFALAHGYFIWPGGQSGAISTLSVALLGISTAVLYQWSRSLGPSIALHALNNTTVFLAALTFVAH
jgi:CAAX protease family protein